MKVMLPKWNYTHLKGLQSPYVGVTGVKIHRLNFTFSRQMTVAKRDTATTTFMEALGTTQVEPTKHIRPTILSPRIDRRGEEETRLLTMLQNHHRFLSPN